MAAKPVNDLTVEEENKAAINLMRRWRALENWSGGSTLRDSRVAPSYERWLEWKVKRQLRTKASVEVRFAELEAAEDIASEAGNFTPVREDTSNMTDKEVAAKGWTGMQPTGKEGGVNANRFAETVNTTIARAKEVPMLKSGWFWLGVGTVVSGLAWYALKRRGR